MAKTQRKSLSMAAATKTESHNAQAEDVRRQVAEEPKKQIHAFIPESLHVRFKLKTVREGKSMNGVIEEFISSYVEGN